MSDTSINGPILAADGTPLRRKLAQAMRRSKLRAFSLVFPLLGFIVAAFIIPIGILLWQGFYNDTFSSNMPRTTEALANWDAQDLPGEEAFAGLVLDLVAARETDRSIPTKVGVRVNRELAGTLSAYKSLTRKAPKMEPPYKEQVIKSDKKWGDVEVWRAMKIASKTYTPAFYAAAVDAKYNADGSFSWQEEDRRIHLMLFWRTLWVAGAVTFFCILLGYPVAYLLATLPLKTSNLLMIMVLLPFWTSLLVRTTSWIAMLQQQGVLNDIMVAIGLISDDGRLTMIYNMTGTLVAMTHILLPFMILPLFSVMKTIPPSYMRAARSLGATPTLAFIRVYMPQTVPGIGAGSLLVFILAVGYYITPALVGGEDGQLISNFIAFHMQKSLNWSLAAAMGGVLLIGVLILYWLYDKIIGIDNMKLG